MHWQRERGEPFCALSRRVLSVSYGTGLCQFTKRLVDDLLDVDWGRHSSFDTDLEACTC